MRQANTPMQRLQNKLANTLVKLMKSHVTHAQDKKTLQDIIFKLETYFAKERANNKEDIRKLTQLIVPIPSTSSAPSS